MDLLLDTNITPIRPMIDNFMNGTPKAAQKNNSFCMTIDAISEDIVSAEKTALQQLTRIRLIYDRPMNRSPQ